MYYTGIDLHKFTSYLTTVDSSGNVVKQADIRNIDHTVESTMTWYWLNDLLTSLNIPMVLAYAKFVKAIAYVKVKTDRVDSHLLPSFFAWTISPLLIKSITINVFSERKASR
jgi:transposase